MKNKIKIHFNLGQMHQQSLGRGIGMYASCLKNELESMSEIEFVVDNPDLTHYPFFDIFFSTLPFHPRSKAIVTIHDVIPLMYSEHYLVGPRGKLSFKRQKAALKFVEAVITDSQSSKAEILKHLSVADEKIHVVELAGNPQLIAQSKTKISEVKKRYKLPEKYILYVGDINYNKNIPQLIKSLQFLPEEIHLLCIGRNFQPQLIPEWKAIETQIALNDVALRVHFLADIQKEQDEDLSALYSGAIVYVQPSIAEGFGLPILEAMQCQTPVVCIRESSMAEVAGDFGVYAQNSNGESFAEAIKIVISWTQKQRKDHLSKSLKRAKKFTWKKTAIKTVAVYKRVLGIK